VSHGSPSRGSLLPMSDKRKQAKTDDRELNAMGTILAALEGLDGKSTQRVLDYVLGRLSLGRPGRLFPPSVSVSTGPHVSGSEAQPTTRRVSIRDLKEEKQPESANQMAALVAYYLGEMVSADEVKEDITTADLEKYFKQAAFRLPKSLKQALPNAAAAGYFDGAGGGRYRLNPVGYNLVVHGLPPAHDNKTPRRSTSKKKARR
jgi:hypothetical protein